MKIEEILKKILLFNFKLTSKLNFFILPFHYYIPLSNINKLKNNSRWQKKTSLKGIEINLKKQVININKITRNYKKDLKSNHLYKEAIKKSAGPGYGYIESQMLFAFTKYYKPKKIIEIGSGVSTHVMLGAGAKNISCIEPFPSNFLKKNKKIRLISNELQDVDLGIFKSLKKGDLLFIDSTHTLKIDSDVTKIYLEILPLLNPGVLVHIHDIFFPYNYQRDADNTYLQWMETQLLQAFLINNKKVDIILCMSHLHYEKTLILKKIFPNYEPQKQTKGLMTDDSGHFPSSIYLKIK